MKNADNAVSLAETPTSDLGPRSRSTGTGKIARQPQAIRHELKMDGNA
jgi:hypothetical protein